jgi:hypothetical protein
MGAGSVRRGRLELADVVALACACRTNERRGRGGR